ncbi:hypothetical protein D3C86_2034940 [compost metagenome]
MEDRASKKAERECKSIAAKALLQGRAGLVGLVERSNIRRKPAALLLIIDVANSLTPQTLVRDATR